MTVRRILLVEDDLNSQKIVKLLLEHSGVEIDLALNAEHALELLNSTDYQLVVIDLSLPGMSGWELFQAIQSATAPHYLPCVATTAFHSPNVSEEALSVGFVAYFPKPLDVRTFAGQLAQFL